MDHARKNRWRRQEAERVRQNRVTQGYIEKKYPEIHKEALDFYQFLNEKYPEKKDLRRTNEFEWVKTGISGQTCKRYYTRKEKKTTTTTTTTTIVNDRMELIIPLMRKDTTNAGSSVSQPQADEQPPAETLPSGETRSNNGQVFLEPAEIVIDSTETLNEKIPEQQIIPSLNEEIPEQQIIPSLNEEIPEQIIERIMSELQNDPHLETFFQTIDYEFNEELICQ